MAERTLYFGDNLEILRTRIVDDSVDLIYLDPPFNSKADYDVLFRDDAGRRRGSNVKAFADTWIWNDESSKSYSAFIESNFAPENARRTLIALHDLLGGRGQSGNGMIAYLSMMAPRLVELRRVLKPSGSIYLHCDPTASHYLKVLMDSIFGPERFRNEIIWRRTGAHSPRKTFGPIHDTILFYTKSSDYYFHSLLRPYMKGHVTSRYKREPDGRLKFSSGGNVLTGPGATRAGDSGKMWRGFDPSSKDRHWAIPGFLAEQMPAEFAELSLIEKLDALFEAGLIEIRPGIAWPTPVRYLAEGSPIQDIWAYQPYTEGTVHGCAEGIDADVAWFGPTDPEKWDYETQKPIGILDRIIRSSCPDDGVVLDPFCGSGTAVAAARALNRKWIGIDATYLAIDLIKRRLERTYSSNNHYYHTYRVEGEPIDLASAEALALDVARSDNFPYWILSQIGGVPSPKRAEAGVDGRIRFQDDEASKTPKSVIVLIKSSEPDVVDVRTLLGLIDRGVGSIGVLVTLRTPTALIRNEAVAAGFYESPRGSRHPRLQIISVAEMFDGTRVDMPGSLLPSDDTP